MSYGREEGPGSLDPILDLPLIGRLAGLQCLLFAHQSDKVKGIVLPYMVQLTHCGLDITALFSG